MLVCCKICDRDCRLKVKGAVSRHLKSKASKTNAIDRFTFILSPVTCIHSAQFINGRHINLHIHNNSADWLTNLALKILDSLRPFQLLSIKL